MPMVRMHWLAISLMSHYEATTSVVGFARASRAKLKIFATVNAQLSSIIVLCLIAPGGTRLVTPMLGVAGWAFSFSIRQNSCSH